MNTGVSQSAQDMTSTSANLSTQDGGSTSPGATEQSLQSGTTDELDYWPHTVFLQTSFCQYSPHALHCTQILPGITLVVVGQVGTQLFVKLSLFWKSHLSALHFVLNSFVLKQKITPNPHKKNKQTKLSLDCSFCTVFLRVSLGGGVECE